MKKWLKICVIAFALTLGLVTASTVDAHASSFTYFGNNGTKTYHHKVTSYQKYTLNKTDYNTLEAGMTPDTAYRTGKVVFYHMYVFHVSSKVSRYRTWVKLTGRVYNYSNSPHNAFWRTWNTSLTGYSQYSILKVLTANRSPYFTFSKGTSKSPILLSKEGLAPGKSEGFQLLAHTKTATSRLGKTTVYVYLTDAAAQTKTLKLNLK
ncbi:hypothetical protein [Secundilactobacillus yichangensis]|uniref:hypothetical protein n=1 Tax=Secundilactobacillus yichangensis TaxID=2799580 RepID=UPI001940415B|nr:hypothetical protein [Secundilactobacillus yichangensis]